MGATAAILTAGSSLLNASTQWRQGDAAKKRGDYVSAIEEQNAKFADWQAEDAIARGYEDEFRRRAETKQTVGTSRAALAAQGIDIDSGSAADVQYQTRVTGELDATTIRNNARREAWGYRVEATNYRQQAKLARIGGRVDQWNARAAAGSTLLTGGAQSYNIWKNR